MMCVKERGRGPMADECKKKKREREVKKRDSPQAQDHQEK